MTSGQFHSILISSITVDREGRQRRDLGDLEELSDSLSRLGLINPITITRDCQLVAGERRLEAARRLGWSHIACQYIDELDPRELQAIELEENIKRLELPWVDRCKAIVAYHDLYATDNPNWTQKDTAKKLGLLESRISEQMTVGREYLAGNPKVVGAPKYSTAFNNIKREADRKAAAASEEFLAILAEQPVTEEIIVTDFLTWAPTYRGPRFNFIHCDFPYGIGADKFNQGSAPSHGGYSDTLDTYNALISCLHSNLDRIAADSCHLLFWFSMEHYELTLKALRIGWDVSGFPLIWVKSDGAGILPDPQRGPRRVYETAFFGARGDRKIVSPVNNAFAAPIVRDRHMSEKNEDMLAYFFRMIVDNTTTMLDPTAGSGSALRAAERLGAKSVLGLEVNAEFAERARIALVQRRMK